MVEIMFEFNTSENRPAEWMKKMPGQKPCFPVAVDDVHIRKYVGNIVTPGEYPIGESC